MEKYLKDKNETIKIRLNVDFKKKYLEHCKVFGQSLSKRIRVLLENDMKNGR